VPTSFLPIGDALPKRRDLFVVLGVLVLEPRESPGYRGVLPEADDMALSYRLALAVGLDDGIANCPSPARLASNEHGLLEYLDRRRIASLSALSDELQRDGECVEVVASLPSEC
jgi:hypothetical protein